MLGVSGFVSKDTKFLICASRYPKEGNFLLHGIVYVGYV